MQRSSPEMIEAMTAALDRALASLPEPVKASHVNLLAESILRTAQAGERDVVPLQRIALLELQHWSKSPLRRISRYPSLGPRRPRAFPCACGTHHSR